VARELACEQLARRLGEDARAVARPAVGRARAAMRHRADRVERQPHELVRSRPAEVGEEARAAGVVLFGRVAARGNGREVVCDGGVPRGLK